MSGDPQSYQLSIDWLGAGGTPDNGDTTYLLSYMIDRGRNQTFTGDPISGEAKLARNKVGQLSFILDNSTRRYDTYNPNSALYPNVVPGKVVKFFVTDDLSNTYALFVGTIDDIRPVYGDDPRVQIVCSDAWKQLSQNPLSTEMYTNGDVSQPMNEIIDASAVSAILGSALSRGSETYPYMWGDDETPYQVLHDLTEMDGGFCHISADGFFYFISRNGASNQTPRLTLEQSQILRDIQVTQPWDGIINYVVVGIHDLTRNPNQVLVWTTPDVAMIPAGGRITRRIQYTGANGKRVPIPSLAGADGTVFNWQANTQADGMGTIVNGLPNVIKTVPPGGAMGLQLTLVNNKSYTIYWLKGSTVANNLCGGQLYSHPLDDLNPSTHALYDATSIALYGTRTLRLDYRYMQGLNNASKVAEHYLKRFKEPRATIVVKIVNRSTVQFAHDLNTLLNFKGAYLFGQSINGILKSPRVAAAENNPNSTGIINPGFETGDFTGWIPDWQFGVPVGGAGWSVESGIAHSGNYSAKAYVPLGNQSSHFIQQRYFASAPNLNYSASGWYNIPASSGTGAPLQIFARFYDSNFAIIGSAILLSTTNVTAGWTFWSGNFSTIPGTAFIGLICGIGTNPSSSITAYVDDFLLSGASGNWNYPNNALLQDGNGAYADTWREVSPASQLYTDYLVLTGFGFAAQPTDVINGISVRIRKKTNVSPPGTTQYPGGSVDYTVKLVKGGVISGNNKSKPETWTNQYADYIYGSPNDLWGVALTYADVNAGNFGIAIAAGCALCNATRGWATAYVESVEITLYTSNGAFQKAFRVVGIKHQTGRTPYEVTTTWTLEPTINNSGALSPNQIISEPGAGELFPSGGGVTY